MIGIIGNGIVGSRLASAFRSCGQDVLIHDVNEERSEVSFGTIIEQSDGVLICVPTPTHDFTQDTTLLLSVVSQISSMEYRRPVILKSTILPGVTKKISDQYPGLFIVHSPEFLNEAGDISDILGRDIIIGRDDPSRDDELRKLFQPLMERECDIILLPSQEAEIIKYMANLFYAMKNCFFNHIRHACDMNGLDYENIRRLCVRNSFIHPVHTFSPGRDGLRGFGGKCLPKDLEAFIGWCEANSFPSTFFRHVKLANELWRKMRKEEPRKDWEKFFGRTR